MSERAKSDLRSLARDSAATRWSIGFAALYLVLTLSEVWIGTIFTPGIAGPVGLQTGVALTIAAAVVTMPRTPVASFTIVVIGTSLQWALAETVQPSFESFLVVLVAAYALGARRPAAVGVVTMLLVFGEMTVVGYLMQRAGHGSVSNNASAMPIAALVWLVGQLLRQRDQREGRTQRALAEARAETERRAAAAVEQERTRISRELHDVVAHNLSVIVLQLAGARRVSDRDPAAAATAIEAAETAARNALGEMRKLVQLVRGGEADADLPQPGLEQLPRLIDEARAVGTSVELETSGRPFTLPPGLDLAAYRIVQEALTNVRKHAGTAAAQVRIDYRDHELAVSIEDDGPGADEAGAVPGHGLIGMRERVALYGGEIETGPRAGGGFAVRARLPLGAAA